MIYDPAVAGASRPKDKLKVCAIIVCFHPDERRLEALTSALFAHGINVILVDNSVPPAVERNIPLGHGRLVTLGYNAGIAAAQNAGLNAAKEYGSDIIVFFDQDSQIANDFLPKLLAPMRRGDAAIFAPRCVDDISSKELPATRLGPLGYPRAQIADLSSDLTPVDVVISSGTAATKEVFEIAGGMNDGLFIDLVDTEWCLRCRSKGIPIWIVKSAQMQHRIGERNSDFIGLSVQVHNPVRCYYQIRNSFLLLRMPHIPLLFSLREIVAILIHRLILLGKVPKKKEYWQNMKLGFIDGIKGVTGAKSG